MSNVEFTVQETIDAPPAAVWAVLADIGRIDAWHSGVVGSHLNGEQAAGLGASRHCDLGGKNFVDERVVTWEPQRRLTMRITATNLPFQAADIHFALSAAETDRTVVSVSPAYHLKYGWAGRLLNRFYVRPTYERGMRSLLANLKRHAEGEKSAMA